MVVAPQCLLPHIDWQYPEVTNTRTDLQRQHKSFLPTGRQTCTRHPLRKALAKAHNSTGCGCSPFSEGAGATERSEMGLDQIGITLSGVIAVWLTQDKRIAWRRWACIFGMFAQPFWFYAAWKAEQWGI